MLIVPAIEMFGQAIIHSMEFYEIAPLSIVRADSAVLTYHAAAPLVIGQSVLIPVGKKTLQGLVVRRTTRPSYETKSIVSVIDAPALPTVLVELALWMSQYYATHLSLVLQTILPKGIAKKRRFAPKPQILVNRERTKIVFNSAQRHAISTITAMSPGAAILHGITGSGKTAVYIELAKRSINQNKSVLLLVPEIALTSQLLAEFTQHFPDAIVTHSQQTEAERHAIWVRVATATEPLVLIGPRSVLFMPVATLGLIVIDEAHEPSYKQDQSPRYSALRVASKLAALHQAKVIQGSATPLVSEYYLATNHGRPIVTMLEKARTDTATPTISLVDMTKKSEFSRHRFLSNGLLQQIETTLAAGKQVLIFHNRRGSASTTLCESCGWSATCPRCFVPFTLHADTHKMMCHICGARERVPTSCPECHATDIRHKGIGTKLIESELATLFPRATIARFDGDVAKNDTLEKRYQELYDGKIQIIIGTQVIAKGLDLPHLTAVGVIQADAGLCLPDYAASERTFQLLAQVVGRVGRSSQPTTIVVQSYQPTALAVQQGLAQHYDSFYTSTLLERQRAVFPPFIFLLKLTCVYKTEAAAIRNAAQLAETIKLAYPDVQVLGPTPAFYERQHNTYRWQLIVKSTTRQRLLAIMATIPSPHWQADIDPASLL